MTTHTFVQAPELRAHAGVQRLERSAGFVARRLANVRNWLKFWQEVFAEAAEDRRMWELAMSDARVMADISRAMNRRIAFE